MADEQTSDQSQAAEARKTIDTLKSENDQLKQQVVALGQQRHVERFVRGRGIADDKTVDQWVDTMMPHAGTINFENAEQFNAALNERFGGLIQPPPASAATPDTPPAPAEGVATPPQAPVPADGNTPSFAQPNPAAPGRPPEADGPYQFTDPHIQGLLAQGEAGAREVEKLYKAGQVVGTTIGGRFPVSERG